MSSKLYTLTKNTFIETIRQPIYMVLIIAALILFFLSPSITMYTMDEDIKLLREIGLSTLLLTSLFIAIFAASGSVADEIENKTITTVLSKPIQRPIFILSKFLGVGGAVLMAHYICTIALLMAVRHGVLESVNDTHDWTVIAAGLISLASAFILSAFFNYVYDWKFTSTAVFLMAIFGTISIIFLYFIDRDLKFAPKNNGLHTFDVYASILLFMAGLVIAAIAVALSTRFNIVVTLTSCIGIFLLGLVTDYAFGELAHKQLWAKACYFVVPNLQIFWVSDAIYEGSKIPISYVFSIGSYSLCYAAAILFLAIALFQRRQIG